MEPDFGLQCLSAVCLVRTLWASMKRGSSISGLQCLSAVCLVRTSKAKTSLAPCGLQCLSAVCLVRTPRFIGSQRASQPVFSAFRRCVWLGRDGESGHRSEGHCVFSAFRRCVWLGRFGWHATYKSVRVFSAFRRCVWLGLSTANHAAPNRQGLQCLSAVCLVRTPLISYSLTGRP